MKENVFLVNLLQLELLVKDFYLVFFFFEWDRAKFLTSLPSLWDVTFLVIQTVWFLNIYIPNLLIWRFFSFLFQKVNLLNLTQCEWTLPLPWHLVTTDQESKMSKVQFIKYKFNPPVLPTIGSYSTKLLFVLNLIPVYPSQYFINVCPNASIERLQNKLLIGLKFWKSCGGQNAFSTCSWRFLRSKKN